MGNKNILFILKLESDLDRKRENLIKHIANVQAYSTVLRLVITLNSVLVFSPELHLMVGVCGNTYRPVS